MRVRPINVDIMEHVADYWPWIIGTISAVAGIGATAQVVLSQGDFRAAIAWAGLIWLAPLAGSILSFLSGINRIRRRARRLRKRRPPLKRAPNSAGAEPAHPPPS